jgi:hypothetical protein
MLEARVAEHPARTPPDCPALRDAAPVGPPALGRTAPPGDGGNKKAHGEFARPTRSAIGISNKLDAAHLDSLGVQTRDLDD